MIATSRPTNPRTDPRNDPRSSRAFAVSRTPAIAAQPAGGRLSRRHIAFLCLAATLTLAALLALPLVTGARARTPVSAPQPSGFRDAAAWQAPTVSIAPGYWHTSGSRILDASENPVRIAGLNWSGFETTDAVPGGLKLRDYRAILRTVAGAGYNTVRLPFSNQMVEHPTIPTAIGFTSPGGPINRDLAHLNSLQILDRVVAAAGDAGLHVILDNHRSEAGSSAEANGLWYTPDYPETQWIADWSRLAAHFRGNPTVIGFDLRNEPHNADNGGSCWDCGGPTDWHLAAERAGNRILRANPDALIFVEGTDSYNGDSGWWGGNLAGVRNSPVRLALPHRLVYSAHVYGPSEYQQPWFNTATTASSLAARWRDHWAFLVEEDTAPVWIGEFGTTNDDSSISSSTPGSEGQWFEALIAFLADHRSIGWTYWGMNGEDRYALMDSNYSLREANPAKLDALTRIRLPEASLASTASVAAEEPAGFADAAVTPAKAPLNLPRQPQQVHPKAAAPPTTIEGVIAEQVRQATARALLNLGD